MRPTFLIAALSASLVISACSDDGVIRRPESDGDGAQGLVNFRADLETRTPEAVPEGPQIDPAAANIDPFKYGLDYSYKEREILERLLAEARQDPEYLERSLAATEEGLAILAPELPSDHYRTHLNCAVTLDVASRQGLLPVRQAQADAARLVDQATPLPTAENMPEIEGEGARDRYAREQTYKDELERLKTRDYLNYFLARDARLADVDSALLGEDIAVCEALLDGVSEEQTETPTVSE